MAWTEQNVIELIDKALVTKRFDIIARMNWRMYLRQTQTEQMAEHTSGTNGQGYSKAHAAFLTSVAKQWQEKKWISPQQAEHTAKHLRRYRRQLAEIANEVLNHATN